MRTLGEIFPFHPDVCLCVFLCRSCTFLFCKISIGRGTYCTLFGLASLCLAQEIHSPCDTTLPHLSVSTADGAVFRGDGLLLLSANKKPRQLTRTSLPQTQTEWMDSNYVYRRWTLDKKGMPNASDLDSCVMYRLPLVILF